MKASLIKKLADANSILYIHGIQSDAEHAKAHQRLLKAVRQTKPKKQVVRDSLENCVSDSLTETAKRK